MMQGETVKEDRDTKAKVPTGAAALAKGLTLLDIIADADEPHRFSELLKLSGLPKPTFARILKTLIAFGLVRQDEARVSTPSARASWSSPTRFGTRSTCLPWQALSCSVFLMIFRKP